jgi:hypothetical protein
MGFEIVTLDAVTGGGFRPPNYPSYGFYIVHHLNKHPQTPPPEPVVKSTFKTYFREAKK